MSGCLLIIMLYILVLCRALLAAGVQTLSIDSQLGTSIEDCFERITIGEQLAPGAIYRNVSELTTRECEQICKQDKQCQSYDYGVGAKGNATCDLSNKDEKELKENNLLIRHPDYDVYVRRFQCEQSPPNPLKPQFDDPGEGPTHRPVFRPEIDEPKRPLSDYISDLRPYETSRPDIRPYPPYRPYSPPYHNQIDERPDDYTNQKPDFDSPPSYGVHKPQDIPFRPERPYHKPDYDSLPSYGLHKPQHIPFRPERPHKPDPYDVLQFEEQYGRPPRPQSPGIYRPDPYYPPQLADDIPDIYGPKPIRPNKPAMPPYRPDDKPQYQYVTRPTKKPRPPEDVGYNKPVKPQDYPTKPDHYAPNDHGPVGPPDRPYKPSRPHYDYSYMPNDRPSYDYHGQYASNYGQNQYQDNSIYLEIYDPPRPYPIKPSYGPSEGSIGYGGSGIYGYGSYSSQNSYGQSQTSQSNYYGTGTITQIDNYNRPHQDPDYKPQKPSYVGPSSNYGSSMTPQQLDLPHESQTSGYGSQTSNKPNASSHKPSGSNQGSYGVTQGSYSNHNEYTSSQASYGVSNRPIYGGSQNTDHKPLYGNPFHGSYETNRPLNDNRPAYGDNSPLLDDRPSYGSNKPLDDKPSYGSNKPLQDDRPSYGSNKPSYNDRPYESSLNRPSYDSHLDIGPSYNKPSYNDDRPYGYNRPPKPLYDDNRPDGNIGPSYASNQPSYGDNRPSYGSNRPSHDSTQSGFTQTGYGNQFAVEDNKNSGYAQKPAKPNKTDGYDRPDVKPVYEFEGDKPGNVPSYIVRPSGEVITSRPVTVGSYGRPGYGREPSHTVSYKGVKGE